MQIKSWQISLFGVVIFGLIIVIFEPDIIFDFIDFFAIGIIVSFLLYFDKTRTLGAVVGIFSSVLTILFINQNIQLMLYAISSFGFIEAMGPIFLTEIFCRFTSLIAGIYYFLKKV